VTDVAVDPLDVGLRLGPGPFGHQVVDVVRQFWMVVYVMREPSSATNSTTAECRESVVYTGAEHPST